MPSANLTIPNKPRIVKIVLLANLRLAIILAALE